MSSTMQVPANSSVQFEDDYIFRNYRSITSTPDLALTEFVANAWDAGAYHVTMTLPAEGFGDEIIVEDDGVGMSHEDFIQIWMTLNYDRQRRQGKYVTFPTDVDNYKRLSYGRNGIGRHSMYCFANYYNVETWQNGCCNKYTIEVSSGDSPFAIKHNSQFKKLGHGTKISTFVHRHPADVDAMIEIISARFLYDPRFMVTINGRRVDLSNHSGVTERKDITLKTGEHLKLTIVDSSKAAMKSHQHGIAFWVSGRLVGKPSWKYGDIQFLDGRMQAAKRYTLIVQTDDLIDDVLPDWTGFHSTPNIKQFYGQFKTLVDAFISETMSEQIKDVQLSVIDDTRDALESLPPYHQREVSRFLEFVTSNNPVVSHDFLKTAVEAMIAIEKSKNGKQLLNQLSNMKPDDLDKLSELLVTWDIDDILSVLNIIDHRLVVIEAIARLFEDKLTDELHTLHPIILDARWLFGPEFDSPMFVSNAALSTVIKTLFKDSDYDLSAIENPRKRPDIVCLNNYSFKAVCTDRVDQDARNILKPDQVLIIELKRGGFEINSSEVAQAENYVRQIRKSGALHKSATIRAFVVGAQIGDVDTHKETQSGTVDVVTYGQLVETANAKLFRLREQLSEHYTSMGQESIVERALRQTKMKGV